jgi:uncharacterized protein YraI
MALTATVITGDEAPGRTYPYLGISSHGQSEVIVYFTAPLTGLCVSAGPSSGWAPGAYHEAWAEGQFQIFHGKIVIEQK